MRKIPFFDDAMHVVSQSEAFYFTDEKLINGKQIRSFNYRLASFSDFSFPYSWNMRGTTYDLETKNILALPMEKFFNYKENPFSDEKAILNKNIIRVSEKMDGSLIYFFLSDGVLYCRTKGTVYSQQAQMAMEIVKKNEALKNNIYYEIEMGLTPMFELISPRNQVVILYNTEELKYIFSRNMYTGEYIFSEHFSDFAVPSYPISSISDSLSMLQTMNHREGLVIMFSDGSMLKLKTDEYYNLAHLKDNLLNEKCLVRLILDEKVDEAKAIFVNDIELNKYIDEMAIKVIPTYNHLVTSAQNFYDKYKELSIKDYAILTDKELDLPAKHLAIGFYKGKQDLDKFKTNFVSNRLWEK